MSEEELTALWDEVTEWVEKHGPSGIFSPLPNRSCWICNPAHEWMKIDKETPYHCFDCGKVYFKGVCISVEKEEA